MLFRGEEVKIRLPDQQLTVRVSFTAEWKEAMHLLIHLIHEGPAIWLVCQAWNSSLLV